MNTFTQEQVDAFRQRLELIAEHQGQTIAILAADRATRDLDAIHNPPGRHLSTIRRMGRWLAARSATQREEDPAVEVTSPMKTETVVIIDATYRVIDSDHDEASIPMVEVL